MEIDPSDARIDWATDATNYVERQKRILKSAAKIAKERQTKVQEELSKKLSDDITARVKKDLGVDSVDTSTPPTATSTQVFKESEIADPRFWAEHKSEILKAQREGRIKIGE
jgi:hypothetical protein